MLWHTGARISEALAIAREDLELNTVRDSLVILVNPKQGERFFRFNRQQVYYQLQKIERELTLPIESQSAHSFRHSFTVNLLL